MPTYEYECRNCGEKFELQRGMNDSDEDIGCPKCQTKGPRRVFSIFGLGCSEGGRDAGSGQCAPRSSFT